MRNWKNFSRLKFLAVRQDAKSIQGLSRELAYSRISFSVSNNFQCRACNRHFPFRKECSYVGFFVGASRTGRSMKLTPPIKKFL
jgi:hypothetical protein